MAAENISRAVFDFSAKILGATDVTELHSLPVRPKKVARELKLPQKIVLAA
jgi:hypothetical protein